MHKTHKRILTVHSGAARAEHERLKQELLKGLRGKSRAITPRAWKRLKADIIERAEYEKRMTAKALAKLRAGLKKGARARAERDRALVNG